jgi:Vanadium chloroperoxidase N-terminal domain/PAP2 superfamily
LKNCKLFFCNFSKITRLYSYIFLNLFKPLIMDVILYWNEVALQANVNSHTTGQDASNNGPTRSSRALAIIHLAMYDAYARAKGNPASLPAYDSALPPVPVGINPQVAAAGAAHKAISNLYPVFAGTSVFSGKLALSPGGTDPASIAYGESVATEILTIRASDPDASDMGYTYSPARGSHRDDPDNPSNPSRGIAHGPKYGALSTCIAVTKRHDLDKHPKPDLSDPDYLRALRQVRGKGIKPELAGTIGPNNIYRTPEETLIGIYWGYDGAKQLGTPPRLYNQIVRQVALEQNNSEEQNARLFALVNAAMGDAGILAWEQKYRYNLMRPVVGIREADKSLGATTVGNNNVSNECDANWLPLGAPKSNDPGIKNFTPNFPAYPSGHATFGAAAFQITRLFYRISGDSPDNLLNGKPFISDEFNGLTTDNNGTIRPRHTRNFPDGGLWQMIVENGLSRVFLGVHWFFDAFALDAQGKPDLTKNIGGVPLGIKIAEDIFNSGMKKSNVGPALIA